MHLYPELGKDLGDQVIFPHAHPTGNEEHVVLETGADLRLQLLTCVASDAQVDGPEADPGALGQERVVVAVPGVPGQGRLVGLDQLVARGQHGHRRPTVDPDLPSPDHGQETYLRRAKEAARLQHHVPSVQVFSLPGDVGLASGRSQDVHPVFGDALCVLDTDHSVCTPGDRGARHYLAALARPDRLLGHVTGLDLLDDSKLGRDGTQVGQADGVAVHGRAVEGGHIDVGSDLLSQHRPKACFQGKQLGAQRLSLAEHDAPGIFFRDQRYFLAGHTSCSLPPVSERIDPDSRGLEGHVDQLAGHQPQFPRRFGGHRDHQLRPVGR